MKDYYNAALQSGRFIKKYFRPSSQKVTHRLKSINELPQLMNDYELFIIDRDGTIQSHHAANRVPEFEETIRCIAPKSELLSNSSYEEMLRIRDIFGMDMPVSKLVNFKESAFPHLLRFEKGKLKTYLFYSNQDMSVIREVNYLNTEDKLHYTIESSFKKPDPIVIDAVIAVNKFEGRVTDSPNPKVLIVGDRYLTDIVCGNLAGIDTALVEAYKPFSDPLPLIIARYAFDKPIGKTMNLFNTRD